MKKTVCLYVERDGSEYGYKAGFASYTEANDYRQECQRSWMGHCGCVYCEVWQKTIFAQISKNILTWQQKTINLSTCYSTGFNAIAITISAMAAETLSIAFGLTASRNKPIKCESFMACCRLNLNGLQENKLMNMQQEWA